MINLNITEEKQNPLFDRKEIKAEIEAEITPNREGVLKMLSEKFSIKQENIKIKSILGKFGSRIFTIQANIYNSKQEKDKMEIKKKKEINAEKKLEAKQDENKLKEAKPEGARSEIESGNGSGQKSGSESEQGVKE